MCITYVLFISLSFGFDFILSSQVISKNANAIFENNDLVEIVKNDLRRNNEDYGEIKYDYKLSLATEGYYGLNKKSTETIKFNDIFKSQLQNRRANVDLTDYNYDDKGKSTTKVPQPLTNATTIITSVKHFFRSQTNKETVEEKFANKLAKINFVKPLVPRTVKPTTNATQSLLIKDAKIPTFVNKNKIDKFKKFMSKNEGLWKKMWIPKMGLQPQRTTSKLRTASPTSSREQSIGIINAIKNIKIPDDDKIALLSPDLLDMAPAKGGRLNRQRVKGRLCQRHVLMPEGPKYNSQGKWYLPAHHVHVDRPYNVTSPPKLILPRCCNCCKKSVLGCE